jgi:chemosensory pili system protein ChpA (sensor histidine kinase/response regulator)
MDVTRTVLIVDDDVVIRRLLRHMLHQHGYEVRVAANGQEALIVLEQEPIAAAIIDRTMPLLDGVDLVKMIRASERHRALPVIMLTASIAPSVQEEAQAIGVNRLITKLVGSQELVGLVDELLSQAPPAGN